ncbi:MAG: response regulator transcription factor [Candidatus Borkfalkia sp.]
MKIKVMIVDDQVILSEGIKTVLATDEELDVIAVASDGVEALEKMEKEVPDVVLLDIRMPNMNGVVTTGEIKKRYPGVKVIILTTFDDSDYILSAIAGGASGYLLKDISADSLISAVKNA